MTNPETLAARKRVDGPFAVSRSSDGETHWFSARDAAAGVTIPAKSREDASALVSSLNRSARAFAALAPQWRAEEGLREDAERWRAFISSDRFYVMGWAGFTGHATHPEVKPDHNPADWLHFTLNVWDKHPAGGDRQGVHGRNLLLAYVEHRRKELAAPTAEEPAGGGEGV